MDEKRSRDRVNLTLQHLRPQINQASARIQPNECARLTSKMDDPFGNMDFKNVHKNSPRLVISTRAVS